MRHVLPSFPRLGAAIALAACMLAAACAGSALAAPPVSVPGSDSPAEWANGGGAFAVRDARASGWTWADPATRWVREQRIVPAMILDAGPTTRISRAQFVRSLVALETFRANRYGTPRTLFESREGATLPDAGTSTIYARAVKLGWIVPVDGRFAATSPVTASDAALGMAGVLGLRPSVGSLATRLRTEVPGVRTNFTYAAAHALNRSVGLRYNVLDPNDENELGPRQAVNVAHGSYMFHVAGTSVEGWQLDEARSLASTFDLPELTVNQRRVLGTGVRLIGQPYVWGGETEGSQAEGHAGFDCSGFSIRIVNGSGVPSDQLARILERTTYDMSDIPTSRRVTRSRLRPADVIFFGERGTASTNEENYHAGVYMGNGWFIHSSGGNGGVAIDSLDGWWAGEFSWGRRALRS